MGLIENQPNRMGRVAKDLLDAISNSYKKEVIESVDNYPPSIDDVDKSLQILKAYTIYYNNDKLLSIVKEFDQLLKMELGTAKEMTIAEIEKELGYKVKVVKEKDL